MYVCALCFTASWPKDINLARFGEVLMAENPLENQPQFFASGDLDEPLLVFFNRDNEDDSCVGVYLKTASATSNKP